MKDLSQYIVEVLGIDITIRPIDKGVLRNFPLYISMTYNAYDAILLNRDFILIEPKSKEGLSIGQLEKHIEMLKFSFNKKVALLDSDLSSINRKRLIEKGINFIVPGKQLYLPDLFIDLTERYESIMKKRKMEKLLPSAQVIFLYHIFHHSSDTQTSDFTFKKLADKLGYTQTAITKAVENLKHFDLCQVEGTKEKFIHFIEPIEELWHVAEPHLVNPVLKRVYIDERPENQFMLNSNESALPEYSEMNPSRQAYYAIEKNTFYSLLKKKQLKNMNDYEGRYCLEVWKYDPLILADDMDNDMPVVDPFSLYLSLKDTHDERIENALEDLKTNNLNRYIYGSRPR